MKTVRQFLTQELTYFQKLSGDQRVLLVSFVLYAIASPLLYVFLDAYVWRQTHNPLVLIEYSVGWPIGLTIIFALNSFLLNKFHIRTLYVIGCTLQGLAALFFLFLGQGQTSALFFTFLGVVLGASGGIYWANRNTLSSFITQGEHRFQFMSLDAVFSTLTSVIMPVIAGWAIILGERSHTYTPTFAYFFLGGIGALLAICAGLVSLRMNTEIHVPIPKSHLFLRAPNKRWQWIRLIEVCTGMMEGIGSCLPVLLILLFLGQENTLGMIQSVVALIAAFMAYIFGRTVKQENYIRILLFWFITTVVGSAIFGLAYTPWSLLTYFALSGLGINMRYSTLFTIFFDVVDEEVAAMGKNRFVYILDREFFLNGGRIVMMLLVTLAYIYSPEWTLRYTLLVGMLLQIPVLLAANRIIKTER